MIYVVGWKNGDAEFREAFDNDEEALEFYYIVRSVSENHTVSLVPYGEK